MRLYDIEQYDINTIKAILYFSDKCSSLMHTTKLDKLLFLAQGTHIKEHKEYLFKDEFILDYPGPKMVDLKQKYLTILSLISYASIKSTDYGEIVIPKSTIHDKEYKNEEKAIYDKLIERYSDSTGYQILQDLEYLNNIFKVKEKIEFEKCLEYFD